MADIDQFTTGEGVTFSANSVDADEWMRQEYDSPEIHFNFPDEQLRALEFRRSAEENKFSFGKL